MNIISKIIVLILIGLAVWFVVDKFNGSEHAESKKNEEVVELAPHQIYPFDKNNVDNSETNIIRREKDDIVNLYFTNEKTAELTKVAKKNDGKKSELEFALNSLLAGPDLKSRQKGISTEIPKGTKLLKIKESSEKIIIDLSSDFQYGGGTESQYVRLNQLIKTVLDLNLSKPVYLYLNGVKAEVIGGEGIIINQPLSETSINE